MALNRGNKNFLLKINIIQNPIHQSGCVHNDKHLIVFHNIFYNNFFHKIQMHKANFQAYLYHNKQSNQNKSSDFFQPLKLILDHTKPVWENVQKLWPRNHKGPDLIEIHTELFE